MCVSAAKRMLPLSFAVTLAPFALAKPSWRDDLQRTGVVAP
jgi:hypothetical protein